MAKTNNNQATEEEAILLGRKLGLFIMSLNLTDDEKQGFVAVLPSLSYEQLQHLHNVFEDAYLREKTSDLDRDFIAELMQIKADYNTQIKTAQAKMDKALDEIAAQLK